MKFTPLADTDWPEQLCDMQGGFATQLNVYRVMAHHPALLRAWADLRNHVVRANTLPDDQLEIVILRTGNRLGSAYEWAHHVVRGRKTGLTDAQIAAVRLHPDAVADERQRLLMTAVDEAFDLKRLTPQTAAALAQALGAGGVFDVIATVGMYTTLGLILNSFDTPIDDDIAAALVAAPFRP